MSFGVGVGDILLITKIGFRIWVNVRGAKEEREDLTADLMEWRDKLKMLEHMLANAQLSPPAAKHAKGQLSEALLTLQVLEELNSKLVKGKAFRLAAWEVCGREEFEKYRTQLKERAETINDLFLSGSVAMVTDTVRDTNVTVKRIENGMKHMGFSPDHDPIKFIDALNRQHLLPWEYCKTWEGFCTLVQMGFKESAGKFFVERGEYDIINEDENGALLRLEEWSNTIKPGILLSMAIVIRKQMETGKNDHRCPACETQYTGSVGLGNELERVKCTFCGRRFQVSSEPRIREIDTTEEQKGLGSSATSGEPSKEDELMHIQRFHVRVNMTRPRSLSESDYPPDLFDYPPDLRGWLDAERDDYDPPDLKDSERERLLELRERLSLAEPPPPVPLTSDLLTNTPRSSRIEVLEDQ